MDLNNKWASHKNALKSEWNKIKKNVHYCYEEVRPYKGVSIYVAISLGVLSIPAYALFLTIDQGVSNESDVENVVSIMNDTEISECQELIVKLAERAQCPVPH